MQLMIVLLVLALVTPVNAQVEPFRTADGWVWRNPIPWGGDFRCVTLLSEISIVAGGDYGVICRSVDEGESWLQATVPDRFIATVTKIVFSPTADCGFAIGGATLLQSSDSGATWRQMSAPEGDIPLDVSCLGSDLYLLTKSAPNDNSNTVYMWDPEWSEWLVEVDFVQGFQGLTHLSFPYAWNESRVFQHNSLVVDGTTSITDIEPKNDPNQFWMLRDSIFYTNSLQGRLGTAENGAFDLTAVSDQIIYLVGSNIYRSRDGGRNFEDLGDIGTDLYSLAFWGQTVGYAVGAKARVINTINSGNFWSNNFTRRSTIANARNVLFRDASTGWIQTSDCQPMVTYQTTDAGETWDTLMTSASIRSFARVDKFHILPDMSKLFLLDSAGVLFKQNVVDHPFTNQVNDSVQDFFFIDHQTGWYVTIDKLYKSVDGGNYWNMYSSFEDVELNAVFFVTPQIGYLGGNQGTVLKSVDGGSHWEDISVAGVDVNGLCFVSPDVGFVAADEGVFFRTTNGGVTWRPRATGTTDDLHTLKFFNASTGYVVTSAGFIATRDGGDHFVTYVTPLGFEVGHTQKTPSLYVIDQNFSSFVYGRGEAVLVGAGSIAGVSPENDPLIPTETRLSAAFPNPFNAAVTFDYALSKPGLVDLRIFDLAGREVAILPGGWTGAGRHAVRWDAKEESSGVYFVRLGIGEAVYSQRMVLIR